MPAPQIRHHLPPKSDRKGSGGSATGSGTATSAATPNPAPDQAERRGVAGSGWDPAAPKTPSERGSGVFRAATATGQHRYWTGGLLRGSPMGVRGWGRCITTVVGL
jgi:hypothetical protein